MSGAAMLFHLFDRAEPERVCTEAEAAEARPPEADPSSADLLVQALR